MSQLSDVFTGPLDKYRKGASFNWKNFKLFLYSQEGIDFQARVYKVIEKYPILFQRSSPTPPTDEIKRSSANCFLILQQIRKLFFEEINNNQHLGIVWSTIIYEMEPFCFQYGISYEMLSEAICALGTQRHIDLFEKNLAGEIIASFCLTEVGHGSNTKLMETVARYEKTTKEFVLNTPNFLAAKCWMGNIGKIGTHAIVYAQLITSDQVNHGIHAFIVNLRNPETLLPYSGVTIGDIGEKIGLVGLDNGFIIFNEYRIPKDCLLNKLADVADDGKYIRHISDPAKQFGISLATILHARLKIVGINTTYFTRAITITLRYAATRKKIELTDEQKLPFIEYQIYQPRLLSYLSVAYIGKILFPQLIKMHQGLLHHHSNEQNNLINMGVELHAISSAAKPVMGWIMRDGMKECLETCADHGYLKSSELDNLRNCNDANCTTEGENHVLMQQASNWLVKLWPLVLNQKEIRFPFSSVNFLNQALVILNSKFNINSMEDFINPNNILEYYQWLVCYLLKKTYEKQERLSKLTPNSFWIKNGSQVYYCKSLAIAYIQAFIVRCIQCKISKASDTGVKRVLTKILSLYGIWNLQEHVGSFYEGGYTDSPKFTHFMEESILLLCDDLKDDAIALVDVIASPDFIIKAALGQSDGQVYEHLEAELVQTHNTFSRPNWWMEVSRRKNWINKL